MSSRKEDEKNERIIRNLLKLPDNRRCINCNSLGPQYVCINFWTFVCTNCSGIHREFTHRVKSISMAKFTSQEVSALQGGGNASAKEIYLKEWDPQRQSLPDGSNVERLRDFIKHVYVERRYSGERSFEKPPRAKMGETEESYENRRIDSFQSGSRSPPYDDERRYGDRPSPGGRSPGYDQDNRQYDKRSPARTEVVNDWRREDRFGNGRRSEDNRVSDGGYKLDSRSPDRQRDLDVSSPPVVRPVRDILGENVSPLRVLEPPKANGPRFADVSTRTQRTASSSSMASSNGNPAEIKVEASLIDFDAAPEPPAPAAVQPQQSASVSVAQTATPSSDNWANFDSVAQVKGSQPPVNSNPLESVLSQLSVPTSVSGHLAGTPGSGNNALPTASAGITPAFPNISPVASSGLPFGNVVPAVVTINNSAAFPSTNAGAGPGPVAFLPTPGGNSFGNAVTVGQWPQPQPSPAVGGQPLPQPLTSASVVPASNQSWNLLFASNAQGLPSAANVQATQAVMRPGLNASSGVATQNTPEAKSSGRKELPEDLFTFNYPSMPVRAPGWHGGPLHGMGFNMPYNIPMPMQPSFPQASRSINPFDVNSDPSPASAFPSMASLQGSLPTMAAPGGLLRTSGLGAPPAHPSAVLPHAPPYGSMMPSNTNMMQQLPGNMPSRLHGQASYGIEGGAFVPLSSNQQLSGLHSVPAAPNTFTSIGGNPFG